MCPTCTHYLHSWDCAIFSAPNSSFSHLLLWWNINLLCFLALPEKSTCCLCSPAPDSSESMCIVEETALSATNIRHGNRARGVLNIKMVVGSTEPWISKNRIQRCLCSWFPVGSHREQCWAVPIWEANLAGSKSVKKFCEVKPGPPSCSFLRSWYERLLYPSG